MCDKAFGEIATLASAGDPQCVDKRITYSSATVLSVVEVATLSFIRNISEAARTPGTAAQVSHPGKPVRDTGGSLTCLWNPIAQV